MTTKDYPAQNINSARVEECWRERKNCIKDKNPQLFEIVCVACSTRLDLLRKGEGSCSPVGRLAFETEREEETGLTHAGLQPLQLIDVAPSNHTFPSWLC